MMIIMKPNATPQQVEHVIEQIKAAGLNVHISQGVEATVIGAVGEAHSIPADRFEGLDGVPMRLDEATERPKDRAVVVDDRNDVCAGHRKDISRRL